VSDRWKSAFATLALAAGGLLGALLVGELAVRLYEGDPLLPLIPPEPYVDNAVLYRTSATRRYELRPDVDAVVGRSPVRIRINHAGFRDDRDYPARKASGTFRILVLGDSFTFAGKVALRETLVKVLEERLQRLDPSRRYEALDLAVPGYNSEQEASALEEMGLRYQPDLVIVAFVLNDALPAGQLVPKKARLPEPVRRILKRSYLVQFVYSREKQLRSEWKKGTFKGASEVRDLAPGTRGYARVASALRRMNDLTSSRGVPLAVVLWPMFERLDAYPFVDQHRLVAETCSRIGVPLIDLLPAFRDHDTSSLWVAANDHHPNAVAQRLAADAVFTDLRSRGIVPAPPEPAAAPRLEIRRQVAAPLLPLDQ
jgi:GDSL-like Lipase/Acylhydrolase family